MSHADLLYRRAMCKGKPFCFLMNTRFEDFSHELVERYMKRSLAYGMFPGFFSHNASQGHYFTRSELYNRDRPLFKKYVPLCKLVAEAADNGLIDEYLQKQIIDIDAGARRWLDHRYLGGQGIGASHAVDLAAVGRAHHLEQERIPGRGVGRQVARQKVSAFGCAAAHPHAGGRLRHT